MFQLRSADPFRTVRLFCQRAIALTVLVSGCVCEDALTSYPTPGTPTPSPLPPPLPGAELTPFSASEPTPGAGTWSFSGTVTTPPTRIEIVPADVATLIGLQFEMRARLFDAVGNQMPVLNASDVEWTITPTTDVTLTPLSPGRVLVKVTVQSQPRYTLSAHHAIYGLNANATIRPVKLEDPQTDDWIAAPHANRAPPMLALVDGTWAAFEDDRLFGFVGGAPLGAIGATCSPLEATHCGETTLFATERALNRSQFVWSSGCDIVDRRDTGGAPACATVKNGPLDSPPVIPLNTWVYATTATDALVMADLGFVKNALRDAWGGVSIVEAVHQSGESRFMTMLFASDGVTCSPAVFDRLKNEFSVTGMAADKATLVMVDGLMKLKADGTTTEPAGWAAYACPYDNTFGAVSIVDWPLRHLTTVSHETGHVLGPWDNTDNWGHTDAVAGAHSSNLMFSIQDAIDFPRWTLTLGQAFRYSLDQNAIMRRGSGGGFDRCAPTTPAGAKCPTLIRDVP